MSLDQPRRSRIARHKALLALVALFGIALALVVGWAFYLNQQIANVPRMDLNLNEAGRPHHATGAAAGGVNILLAGADSGDSAGPTIAQLTATGRWTPGTFRSDTIMVLHITADRSHAYLISVPRDSWVDVPGYGRNKINAAFSFGGPSLYVRTMEDFTGLRMDHVVVIDWAGFKDLTTALGGVQVYVPETVRDGTTGKVWTKGMHTVAGQEALSYVRQRHGLPGGDLDRIKRQQNLMRSMVQKMLSSGTLKNPVKLTGALRTLAGNVVVDRDFGTGEMRRLALSLRGLRSNGLTFVTVPVKSLDTIEGQSVVRVDLTQVHALFGAVLADELDEYVAAHPGDLLGSPGSVR
jgi:LCP family protein required for cell wall assembly